MPTYSDIPQTETTRDDVDAMQGDVLLEFGTSWCGHCISARPLIARALDGRPDVRHILVEDGRGRRLGRSFGVKLWPTLVRLRDGVEVARVVRPTSVGEVDDLFAAASLPSLSPQPNARHSTA